MLGELRKNRGALLLVVIHALAIAAAEYFGLRWFLWTPRSPAAGAAVSATVLVVVGVDLGLLGLWAALGSCRPIVRRLAMAACIIVWCECYEPNLLWMLRNARYLGLDWQLAKYHFFFELAVPFGLALLTVAGIACALGVVKRRGGTFRQLTENERQREAGLRQFQLSHLLLLTLVLSLVFGFSINGRQWLSRAVSMRWQWVFEAPIYSAETVLFSAFCLATITLATARAVLGLGRPWLRLAMVWAAASFLGAALGLCVYESLPSGVPARKCGILGRSRLVASFADERRLADRPPPGLPLCAGNRGAGSRRRHNRSREWMKAPQLEICRST